jgi:serine/threonine-protein kinase
MSKIVQGDFKAPRELVPSYPETLERIVVRALARNPDDRYQSAEALRLGLEEWLAKSGKIVTHTDISRAVGERLNPKVRDQIQALRSANRFSPQTAIVGRRDEDEDDDPDSWELPTAVSGLIQVPDGLIGEMARPVKAARGAAGAGDTQPSIAPRLDPADPLASPEPTQLSSNASIAPDVRSRSTDPASPMSRRGTRASESRATPAPPSPSDPSLSTRRDERKRSILLALMVMVLVVLAFFAGRL